MRLLQGKQHLPIAESLQALKPIRISLPSRGLAGILPAQIQSEEGHEDTKEPSSSRQNQAKLWPNPVSQLWSVMSTGTSLLQPCCPWSSKPAGLLEIRMGAWDTVAIILTASLALPAEHTPT